MRIVRFVTAGAAHVGVLRGDGTSIADITGLGAEVTSLIGQGEVGLALLAQAVAAAEAAGDGGISLDAVELLPPLVPPTILCTGQNFVDHIQEKPGMSFDWGGPVHFVKLPQCVVGPGATVRHPGGVSDKLDYESELAVVIGKPGKDISPENAFDHVYGYTIINDMSLRDWQVRNFADGTGVSLLGVSKNFDCAAPLGPAIVTKDEIRDPHALRVQCLVNGIVRQDNNTANLVHDIPRIIEFFSRFLTLQPGTVIATGSCAGTAWGMDPELAGTWPKPEGIDDPYLHPGDRVDCIVEGVGTLSNTIV